MPAFENGANFLGLSLSGDLRLGGSFTGPGP
jgi:hypothetical protein